MAANAKHPENQLGTLGWIYTAGLLITAVQIIILNWNKCTGNEGCELGALVETILFSISWPLYWTAQLV